MPFSALPPEIVCQIILHAVKVRGIKRAGRLRYVSKSWDAAVLGCRSSGRHMRIWSLGRAREALLLSSTPFRAENYGQPNAVQAAVHHPTSRRAHHCVSDLCWSCDMSIGLRDMPFSYDWFVHADSPTLPIDEHDKQFLQALLAAAAWTNEVALAHEILPFFRHCLHLIRPSGSSDLRKPVIGYPLSLAAYRGNNEIMSLLLGAVTTDGPEDLLPLSYALKTAIRGNQLSTVELILEPQQKWGRDYNLDRVPSVRGTADIDIFKRLVPLIRDYFIRVRRHRSKPDYWRVRTLPEMVCSAASNGNLAILKYLVEEEGAELPERWYKTHRDQGPVESAAKDGRIDALVYLLSKGIPLRPATPHLAARSRNPDVMRVAVEGGMQQNSDLEFGPALLTATERENEQVVRLLLSCEHVRIDDESKTRARLRAETLGLESMVEMLVY
ncbi:hypothetical protein FHL15_010461 [Xylaria flabelliformis]|uniref:F-box domain-containing protein n=1 Tax=Xylaria flabelliformis TaxID=2512241 RepID=A0A553HKX9_9PEZI|nr:hypothetical protein FHL15_010461 [Xylaria flabelliformis]